MTALPITCAILFVDLSVSTRLCETLGHSPADGQGSPVEFTCL